MISLEGVVKKWGINIDSVNIKNKIVKLKILKMLVKSQKIVEQANSI